VDRGKVDSKVVEHLQGLQVALFKNLGVKQVNLVSYADQDYCSDLDHGDVVQLKGDENEE